MAKYIYPAIFTPEADGQYSVRFPDIRNCFSGGESLVDAMAMANDALCLMLYDLEQAGAPIPAASAVADVQALTAADEFVSLVACDTIEYRRFYDNRAVKKTLSIPSWLNDMAEKADINFSATLQNALKAELHIN